MRIATDRVIPGPETSATEGRVVWDAVKSLWWFGHLAGANIAVVWFWQWDAILAAAALTGLTICAGHSVGMHRLLIHHSFQAPLWLERTLVWLGTLVGMAGPFGMIRAHDVRDWHQRQTECPPHPSHAAGFWRDAWWQIHCRFDLAQILHSFISKTQLRTTQSFGSLNAIGCCNNSPLHWGFLFWAAGRGCFGV